MSGASDVMRYGIHTGTRPRRHGAADRVFVRGRHEPVVERGEGVAVLLHGQERHAVGGTIVEVHPGLCGTNRIGERAAAGAPAPRGRRPE